MYSNPMWVNLWLYIMPNFNSMPKMYKWLYSHKQWNSLHKNIIWLQYPKLYSMRILIQSMFSMPKRLLQTSKHNNIIYILCASFPIRYPIITKLPIIRIYRIYNIIQPKITKTITVHSLQHRIYDDRWAMLTNIQ